MTARRTQWLVLVGAVAAAAPALAAKEGTGEAKSRPAEAAAKVLIRPVYETGRALRYRLKLSGAAAWTPKPTGVEWGRMATEFIFGLRTKTLRDDGSCTFALLGEKLTSAGEGPDGKIEVAATPEKIKAKAPGKWHGSRKKGPLAREMTMTFGPRGAFRFGTGLAPIAIYMLPHVKPAFWSALTVAPAEKVAPGDKWAVEFDFPVPGAKGKPLHVKGEWRVIGWRTHRGQKVLAIAAEAGLELKDSKLLLKNGDEVHVVSGTYHAKGQALWDVAHGVLCAATAEQKVLIRADKPTARAFRSECRCALDLLQVKIPK